MHYLSKFACVVLSAGLLLTGCKGKDGDPGPVGAAGATGPVGPSGQNLTGSILGFVNPVSEDGAATTSVATRASRGGGDDVAARLEAS